MKNNEANRGGNTPGIKKKVGRPPSTKPNANQMEIHGLVSRPQKEGYSMELIYESPASLKKVFSSLYACNKKSVYMEFDKAGVTIACEDHYEKLSLIAYIDGALSVSYFCEENISFSIEGVEIDGICKIIKKNFGSIKLYIKERCEDPKKLYICLYENSIKSEDSTPFSTCKADMPLQLKNPLGRKYDISFKLPSAHFKKRLNTYLKLEKNTCEVFAQVSDKSAQLEYRNNQDNSKNPIKTKYTDSTAIDFKILTPDIRNVTCLFKLEYFSNVFKSVISNDFLILLSQSEGICLKFVLDTIEEKRIKNKVPNQNMNAITVLVFSDNNT